MFCFKLKNPDKPPIVSNNLPVEQSRLFANTKQGRTFIDAVRKITSQAARFFKAAASTHTQATQSRVARSQTSRSQATPPVNPVRHSIREVRFASSPRVGKNPGFPNQVKHSFTAGTKGSKNAPEVNRLLPQLSKSIQGKQGFVYLYEGSGASPMANFVDQLKVGDSVDIGGGCRIVGAFKTPDAIASVYSPQWTLQVYDSSLECAFEVPVTEIPLQNIKNPGNTTDQLLHAKNCMDAHLRALPDAFKDSPSCPAIICPQHPRLAQLITAQEECLGRQYRGELKCREGIDWIYAAEDTLKTISPETPQFIGEESVDFESFFNRNGLHAFADHKPGFSIASAGENHNDPVYIRAFKRHIPHAEAHKSEQPIQTIPTATTTATPISAPTAPAHNWLEQRNQGLAFKEPQLQMQCASQAINCLMQHHAMNPEQVASFVVVQKLQMLEQLQITPSTQAGLMHPTVVEAMLRGQSVTISEADFLGTTPDETCIATELAPTQSWRQLINIGAVERNQNWVNHSKELSAIKQITITPEDWLSVQRGTEMRDLLELANTTLANSRQPHQPHSMTHLNVREHPRAIAQQEQRAQQFIARGKDFPIIVRTGGVAGHYYTIVPDQHGNWLGLNAMGTAITGVQPCDTFSRAGDLAQTLQRLNVTDILVPTPQLKSRK